MILDEKDQEIFLDKLKEILAEINFGHILCNLVISDGCLMYMDIKRENNERVFIHGKPSHINNINLREEKQNGKE